MTPRNISTGAVLEAMILPAVARGGCAAVKQQTIGTRCGGGAHKVDAIATRGHEPHNTVYRVLVQRRKTDAVRSVA